MYIYRQNYDKTTMHYYVQFYCMITKEITACIFFTYKVTTVTYILECNEIQKTVALLSLALTRVMTTDCEREGHDHVRPVSYDQPYTYAGNTLREKILCQVSV